MALIASCSDRNAQTCKSLTARLSLLPSSPGQIEPILAAGATSLNSTASLAAYEGRPVVVRVTGEDSAGQSVTTTREVWVFAAGGIQRVTTVPGLALDFDGGRMFYSVRAHDGRDILHIRAADGSDVTVFDVAGRQVRTITAFLIPSGAIWATTAGSVTTDVLYEIRNGSLDTLSNGYVSTLAVTDTFAVWRTSSGTPLYLRDLVRGQTTIVANDAADSQHDVSAGGDVAPQRTAGSGTSAAASPAARRRDRGHLAMRSPFSYR